MRRWVLVFFLLGSALLPAGCGRVSSSATGWPDPRTPTPTLAPVLAVLTPEPTPVGAIPYIIAEELWQRLQAGEDIIVVDTRPAEDYRRAHIIGALHIPESELDQRLDLLSRERLIVFYCN